MASTKLPGEAYTKIDPAAPHLLVESLEKLQRIDVQSGDCIAGAAAA